jgi:hypothetical protein
MPKKKVKTKKKPIVKVKVPSQEDKIKDVMSAGLTTAYDLGVAQGAVVAGRHSKENKAGNVDALPERRK